MIDRRLLPFQHRLLAPAARRVAAAGVGAEALTLVALGLAPLTALLIATGQWPAALGSLAINRLLDGLDGAVARIEGPTDRGAFLDAAADFIFYALVPLGFALADPGANALAAAALLAAFLGTGSSFLAFSAIAARRGLTAGAYPGKGIYYLGGLTEGAETIAVFVAMLVWPAWFPALAWGFAALCLVTILTRLHMGWVAFAGDGRKGNE